MIFSERGWTAAAVARFAAAVVCAVLALFAPGCASEQYLVESSHPEIAVDSYGGVFYRGSRIEPADLPDKLRDSGLTREDTIFIHIPAGLRDYRTAYLVMGILARNGFPRPILVEDRKASSEIVPPPKRPTRR